MKKSEIRTALEGLKTIKMPKIEDKALRNDLITDHLFLLAQRKALDEAVKDIETAHLGAYEEERQQVSELQQRLQNENDAEARKELVAEINTHKDLFKAIQEHNKAVVKLGEEEITLPRPLDADAFIKGMEKQDYDLSLVEQLFPMFSTPADQ